MSRIEKNSDFVATLSTLPMEQQHTLAKKFISGVIHLSDNPRLNPMLELLKKPECSADDISKARSIAQSVYVETGPHSDIAEVKYNCQATHFIAQAVLACTTPDTRGASTSHLAHKVANYCRMAQTCSSMGQGGETPDFANAETEYNRIAKEQIDITNQFLESPGS
jgi:hypothetical protein